MAHIQLSRVSDGTARLIVNGVDLSMEVFEGIELVDACDDPQYSSVGLRVTIAVSRLDLDRDADVQVTGDLAAVAERVRSYNAIEGVPA